MPNIIRKKRGCSQIKIPKTFTLEKEGLDKSLEQLISKDYYSLSSVTSLLNSFDTFMQRINPVPDFLCPLYRMYEIGEEMSKKFLYTKRDIEELSCRVQESLSAFVA